MKNKNLLVLILALSVVGVGVFVLIKRKEEPTNNVLSVPNQEDDLYIKDAARDQMLEEQIDEQIAEEDLIIEAKEIRKEIEEELADLHQQDIINLGPNVERFDVFASKTEGLIKIPDNVVSVIRNKFPQKFKDNVIQVSGGFYLEENYFNSLPLNVRKLLK